MKLDSGQMQLSARMKLLKRHVREWLTLLKTQREVRCLVQQELNQQPQSANKRIGILNVITKYGIRYDQLLSRQSSDRYQMSVRHQQEEIALDQTIKNSTPNSN